MGIDYGTEVKLLAVTGIMELISGSVMKCPPGMSGPQCLIEWSGRLCYNAEDRVGTKPGWIQERIKEGHESILEHSSATFYVRASRVFTHELVRHRIASYSQRSQRYVKETEPRYIIPVSIRECQKVPVPRSIWAEKFRDMTTLRIYEYHMACCWEVYGLLLEAGIKPEDARYVLPGGCETQVVKTMNFRELRHFIKLRTSKRALGEMQEVAGKIKDICKQIAPEVFADL